MQPFAQERETWLRSFLRLPNGIPSHDTLSDVIGRLDPVVFRAAFTAWATDALPNLGGEQVCVDGKTVRGSRDGDQTAIHLVSAFAGQARWVLAQQAMADKSNEITAIPDLLNLLDLEGAVVSIARRWPHQRCGLQNPMGTGRHRREDQGGVLVTDHPATSGRLPVSDPGLSCRQRFRVYQPSGGQDVGRTTRRVHPVMPLPFQ